MTQANAPLVRALCANFPLTAADIQIVDRLDLRERTYQPGADFIHQGQTYPSAMILVDGWLTSYKVLRGGGRQIIGVHVPGDILGLRSFLMQASDHNVEPITTVKIIALNTRDMMQAFSLSPRLGLAILVAGSGDEAIAVEHLVSLGRRDAMERTVHFMLELWTRLRLVGRAKSHSFDCPLAQFHLADALGLSTVHVNRVLREVRSRGLLTFRKGVVTFDDFDAAVKFADFDMSYLHGNYLQGNA